MKKKEFKKFKKEFMKLWREVVFERFETLLVPRLNKIIENFDNKGNLTKS